MPRFDGTGPRGEGPFSGRGEGYCAVRIPDEGSVEHEGAEPLTAPAGWRRGPIRLGCPTGPRWHTGLRPGRGHRGRHGRRFTRR